MDRHWTTYLMLTLERSITADAVHAKEGFSSSVEPSVRLVTKAHLLRTVGLAAELRDCDADRRKRWQNLFKEKTPGG